MAPEYGAVQQPARRFGPGFANDPYPPYQALRATDAELWDDALDAWVLTRYVDVASALNDPRLTRGSTPDHTRLRALAKQAFTPRAIDFDDCGYGHHLYDLGVTLSELQHLPDYPTLRSALLVGYRRRRSLPAAQERYLDTFVALR